MKYVYVLQSELDAARYYVGNTVDLKKRLAEHNRGESPHTKKFLPWRLINYFAFSDPKKADNFEAYLKTASGRAFSKKHFSNQSAYFLPIPLPRLNFVFSPALSDCD